MPPSGSRSRARPTRRELTAKVKGKAEGKGQRAKGRSKVSEVSRLHRFHSLPFALLPFAFSSLCLLHRAVPSSGRVTGHRPSPGSWIVPRKPVLPSSMSTACPASSTTPRSSRRASRCSTTTRTATSTCISFRDGGSARRRPPVSAAPALPVRWPAVSQRPGGQLRWQPHPALYRRHRRERDQSGRLRDGGSGRRLQQRWLHRPVPHQPGTRPAVPQQL